MEALYSKLYDKYTKLKTKKDSEMEKLNHDQEVKFLTYVSAADELIDHLKNENEKLRGEVNDLRSEVASIRVINEQQYAEQQKLLMEEQQKNKEIEKEIERLRSAERGLACIDYQGNIQKRRVDNTVESPGSGVTTRSKRRRYSQPQIEANHQLENDQPISSSRLSKESLDQAKCCRPRIGVDTGSEASATMCIFQELVECIIGMKLSFNTTTEMDEICILSVHQSSGYTFSLTWRNREAEEVVYRVVSLGTFEKVAPEWMREVIIFNNHYYAKIRLEVVGYLYCQLYHRLLCFSCIILYPNPQGIY